MAILVDLKADVNHSKVDLKDVYIRIDRTQIQPKFGIMKLTIEGYISSGVQDYIRAIEEEQIQHAIEFFKQQGSEIISGSLYSSIQEERNEFNPPPFTQDYPISVFHEVYTVNINDETGSVNVDDLYPVLYRMISTDDRFDNVRDA